MKRIIFAFIFSLACLWAQAEEELRLIAYYPSPRGAYKFLEVINSVENTQFTMSNYSDSNNAIPQINFRKSRGTIVAPQGIDGDFLGRINFMGNMNENEDYSTMASIYAINEVFIPVMQGPGEIAQADGLAPSPPRGGRLIFQTGHMGVQMQDRMAIDMDGNVGIGTIEPFGRLHIAGDNDNPSTILFMSGEDTAAEGTPEIKIGIDTIEPLADKLDIMSTADSSDAGVHNLPIRIRRNSDDFSPPPADNFGTGIGFSASTNPRDVGAKILFVPSGPDSVGDLVFATKLPNSGQGDTTTEKIRITDDGMVGIGTTFPDSSLQVRRDQDDFTRIKIQNLSDTPDSSEGILFSDEIGDLAGVQLYDNLNNQYPSRLRIFNSIPGPIEFATTDSLLIQTNGDVGIGIGAGVAKAKLDVNGSLLARSDLFAWGNVSVTKNVVIKGSLSVTGAKNFVIDHPLDSNKKLIHACLEGPESAVYYRGEGQLKNGEAVINLPGYFEALTRKEGRTVQLTCRDGWSPLYAEGGIVKGKFIVKTTRTGELSQPFYWEVKAVRVDIPLLEVEVEK